ncbi:translation initiation factor Sui1 [Limihaloglobus sulfuriphilus]|uniref:Translation initiation factor Sui1 n=1 Tax=Limihaloglobus sulfuriphilus TaxID=1851148 RepID=A0A1Q2MJ45_9BACT|nr:translation initiation factor Sui1 [Limihaloglobus sulfuriphilus]AQQ72372.1 translation initiation factor Sui1 [Limihaloglobus sulfuriphilus]
MNDGLNINPGLVYSTDSGRMCPDCGRPVGECRCRREKKQKILGDGRVRISRQTKGRKGKGVTVITGLPLSEEDLKELAKKLKSKCGCGGTVKDADIEIQGDQRDRIMAELTKLGYKPKLSGG